MHETTGNKPAKLISSHSFLATATEMKNKPNMSHKPQHTYTPNPENLKVLIKPHNNRKVHADRKSE
jgi:hypothetical protein